LSQSAAYVRDVLGARSAVDSAVPLPTPADKGVNVDRHFADTLADGFKVTDRGESSALPLLKGAIERLSVVGDLAQARPGLAGIPGESELCIARHPEPVSPPFHRSSDLLTPVADLEPELPALERHQHSPECLHDTSRRNKFVSTGRSQKYIRESFTLDSR
jgi:hypothetical protein